jgi:hypothetical protein
MHHVLDHLLDALEFFSGISHLSDATTNVGLKCISVLSHLLNFRFLLVLGETLQLFISLYFYI